MVKDDGPFDRPTIEIFCSAMRGKASQEPCQRLSDLFGKQEKPRRKGQRCGQASGLPVSMLCGARLRRSEGSRSEYSVYLWKLVSKHSTFLDQFGLDKFLYG